MGWLVGWLVGWLAGGWWDDWLIDRLQKREHRLMNFKMDFAFTVCWAYIEKRDALRATQIDWFPRCALPMSYELSEFDDDLDDFGSLSVSGGAYGELVVGW